MSNPSSLRIERPDRLLRDKVTDTLRNAVLNGVFAPGERLTERELIELTGVSRTSLREGLRQLQAEGLLEPAEGRGLRVISLTEAELVELYQVREYLESAVVELFVLNASDEQVAALEREFETAEIPGSSLEPRSQYYDVLFEGAGNELLRRLYESIASRIGMMQNLSLRSTGRPEASRHEVRQMIQWIKARHVARAVSASREHVRSAKEAAIRALNANPGA